ncbi:uncharacterized protein LOC21409142 [Morus notabilis]|uniref:uncharacterized protein LOC21409142 n=1 Tax=Morus notabilis TaxID=981085 RepID=UPI000CED02C9|nr:uncharacterized protein LOC21409142 [Morus notabilis]
MHQIPRINPIISLIDHEQVKPWLTLSLALFFFCPIFTFFALFCLFFSLFFLLPTLTLILALKLLFHEPFRIIDVRSAILGTKFNFPSELQSLISTLCTDIDEERIINNTTTLERQLEHNSKEKQVNFDLDSTELPSFSETDDDDEKGAKERSTVEDGEQSQQILVPETDVKREEFREPWFSDVLTFWKRMEKGELEEALGRQFWIATH